jgi:hypothetical protein
MIADSWPWKPVISFLVLLAISMGQGSSSSAAAQEMRAIPEYTGDRVYVRDMPDHFQSLNRAIKALERNSPQTYFVVIIGSAGKSSDALANYMQRLKEAWSNQADRKGLKLDRQRSIITLAAIDDRKVQVLVGTELRDRFGLRSAKVEDAISRVFAPLAREQKFPQALASLLAALNNEIAEADRQTAAVSTGTELFPNPPARVVGTKPGELETASPAARQVQPASTGSSSTSQRDIILALIGSLVAVGLIIAGLIWLARHRTRNTVEGKIKEFKKKAVDAMDKLDALKERLKLLPKEDPDFKEPMSGATLSLYEETQTHLTGLWDRWLEVMDTLDKAQALAKKDSALGTEKLKEAEKLVSDSKIFEQIEEQSKACVASMDRLNQAHENARSAAEVVAGSQKEIHERVEHVEKEGLPTVPYKPEIDAIAAQAEAAGEILTPDPIGARESLDQAQERAVTLRDRVQQILERYADGRKISAELSSLAEEVAKHRREGLRLDEDGGDPDHPIALTFQTLEGLRKAVREGDAKTALEQLQEAQNQLKQSQQTLEGVLKAKDACAKEQPQRVRDIQRLREALGQYEAFEAELKRDFAPESWQAVSGNLAQARALLETFDRKAEEVASDAAAQKYLLGARLLAQLTAEQQAVNQLMAGVGEQLSTLKALRQECQTAVRSLEEQAHATSRYFSQNAQVTGAMAKATLAAAEQSREQLNSLLAEPRPDWPRIRQLLARALEEFAIARNQAETDARLYQELSSMYDKVRQDSDRVGAFLAGHEEDRLAANQHYQAATTALQQIERESSGPGGEWARLLEQVRGAALDLAHSERLAREDIRLARQAEAEIQEAVGTLRKARAFFSMGVTLNTFGADSQVAQAEQLYRSQNYEQAIRTASAAIQQVRQAHAVAVQQAFWRQMTAEANRRRSMPFPMGGPFIRTSGVPISPDSRSQSSVAARAGSVPSVSAPEAASGTATGSWSGETTEQSW